LTMCQKQAPPSTDAYSFTVRAIEHQFLSKLARPRAGFGTLVHAKW
jgi:hypothetical protein